MEPKSDIVKLAELFEQNTRLYKKMDYNQLQFVVKIIREYCLQIIKGNKDEINSLGNNTTL